MHAAVTDSDPSRLVAIGLPADGVKSLLPVLQALPSDFRAAVVITQHQRAGHPEMLTGLLAGRTKLHVKTAAPDDSLCPSVVYVAPPDHHLVVERRRLRLDDGPPINSSRPSIDLMLRSAAASWRWRAIGVLLSGAGGDGAEALRPMQEAGGIVILQDPRDATFPMRPQRAIEANHIRFTIPLIEIGPLLVHLVTPRLEAPEPIVPSVNLEG